MNINYKIYCSYCNSQLQFVNKLFLQCPIKNNKHTYLSIENNEIVSYETAIIINNIEYYIDSIKCLEDTTLSIQSSNTYKSIDLPQFYPLDINNFNYDAERLIKKLIKLIPFL